MSLSLRGIGTAVPPTILTQEDALRLARVLCSRPDEQATWLPGMYQGTGIRTRRVVLGEQVIRDVLDGTTHSGSVFLPTTDPNDRGPTTGERLRIYAQEVGRLAMQAAGRALAEAGTRPGDITHLITVSCTGFTAPGVDRVLIGGLGLPATVQRTHLGYMGCHGAINGLRVAQAFADADSSACVLLCAVELCSLHYHYGWDPQRMVANALFADGAAAVVGTSSGDGLHVTATGSCMLPESADDMAWTIGDHGFEMTLSRRVPGLIARHLPGWLDSWLAANGLRREDVRGWAIHPGGPRILEAVEESLGLSAETTAASRAVFAEYGNMSSPTVLFILDRLRQQRMKGPIVLLGFGPGLVAEAGLIA
jgi:predicted naringenin-chalcone synthase